MMGIKAPVIIKVLAKGGGRRHCPKLILFANPMYGSYFIVFTGPTDSDAKILA